MKCSTCCAAFLLTFAVLAPFVNVMNIIVEALAYVPSEWIGKGIALWVQLYSVHILKWMEHYGFVTFEDCFEDKAHKKVILVLAKGGTIFVTNLAVDLVTKCGITMGAEAVDSAMWPVPPMVSPTHDMDLYLAFAVPTYWEEQMTTDDYTCVAVTRDPLERFISMYKYGRDGAETGLLPHASAMRRMKSVEKRVRYAWRYYGRAMMEEGHEAMMKGINKPNCIQVKVDKFFKGDKAYEEASREFLEALGVKKSAQPALIEAFKAHDISKNKDSHSHASGKKLDKGEEKEAREIIKKIPEIFDIVTQQRKDLHY